MVNACIAKLFVLLHVRLADSTGHIDILQNVLMKKNLLDNAADRKDDWMDFTDMLLDIYPGPYAMLQACLDESENGNIFCVSGVLLDRKSMRRFDTAWKRELHAAKILYYHAVDCSHGTGILKGKDKHELMDLHKQMCQIIRKCVIGSVTVASLPWHFEFRKSDWKYSEYTVCAYLCMNEMFTLASKLNRCQKISFFIEDGHAKQGELSCLLRSEIDAGRTPVERYSFTGKRGFYGVQAADVFAYEVCKRLREKSVDPDKPPKRALRKSLEHIATGKEHRFTFLNDERRQEFFRLLRNDDNPLNDMR